MSDLELLILQLCAALVGHDGNGSGLLVLREGRRHTPKCPYGQRLTPGLGGDPCSARCLQAVRAVNDAEDWLKAQVRPEQARLRRRRAS